MQTEFNFCSPRICLTTDTDNIEHSVGACHEKAHAQVQFESGVDNAGFPIE